MIGFDQLGVISQPPKLGALGESADSSGGTPAMTRARSPRNFDLLNQAARSSPLT